MSKKKATMYSLAFLVFYLSYIHIFAFCFEVFGHRCEGQATFTATNCMRQHITCLVKPSDDIEEEMSPDADDKVFYTSFRDRILKLEDIDEPIPFFEEDEQRDRESKRLRLLNELQPGYLNTEEKYIPKRDSIKIAWFTVQSLLAVSLGSIVVTLFSYAALGPKFVHERGDMKRIGIVDSSANIPRYVDPDWLLREEIPDDQLFGRTDIDLYNQLFDSSLYDSSS